MNDLQKKYHRQPLLQKQLLQISAFLRRGVVHSTVCEIAKEFDLRQTNGRPLTQTNLREFHRDWTKLGFASDYSQQLSDGIMETLIRDGLKSDRSSQLIELSQKKEPWEIRPWIGDYYLAFYRNDAEAWKAARRQFPDGQLPLLDPFCKTTFAKLSPEMQLDYFSVVLPKWIVFGNADPDARKEWQQLIDAPASLPSVLLPRLLEWGIASGNLSLLERIHSETRGKFVDVEGSLRLLKGDLDEGFRLLATTLSTRASKKSLTKAGGLPSVFAMLSAIAGHSSASREQAIQAIVAANRSSGSPYSAAMSTGQIGLDYLASPSASKDLIVALNKRTDSPLSKVIAGYLQAWFASEQKEPVRVKGLLAAATALESGGCAWLAAETLCAEGRTNPKTASTSKSKSEAIHEKLGTSSLINFVQPTPEWERTLDAIAMLGVQSPSLSGNESGSEPTNRLIFEISHNRHDFSLEVFQQIRKGSNWSAGRKVALSRLFHQFSEPEFSFLTPEDIALCQTLRNWSERGSYGYPEEYTIFETRLGARALIGHPRIFRAKKREQPLEIVEKPVALIVSQADKSTIEIKMDPVPQGSNTESFQESGPHQISITFFDPAHLNLHSILRKGLKVPSKASAKVLDTITRLASLVTIHSEIENLAGGKKRSGKASSSATDALADGIVSAKKVKGDPQTHLHLVPSGNGLRADFYVQPLGAKGPICRPGEGGVALFSTIDGHAMSANRDLATEVENAKSVIEQCETITSHLVDSWSATFETPTESLDALLELEPFAKTDSLVIHWPKGQSLRLVGEASESMMRVKIRRDGNWFAASGELKVDGGRAIDMMQLLDLVSASPGRFISIGDGEFVALANNLRQRIDDLRMFGDLRSAKGKLRFGAVHTGLFEDLGGIRVTADAHWKKCLARMKQANEIDVQVPENFQAELRPYQQDGIAWMQRLAAWGVGGCLADDMGLGKTVQAIALLLQRGNGGPSIVVAPTSVIHNWNDEIIRFAPTLNPRILAEASRKKLLDSLKPRDVLLCSYGLMQNEITNLKKIEFNTLILDEAQAIKNAATQRSKAAKQLKADCRFLLTGTPMENHLGELWNLMDFINPGLLGSSESFHERFSVPIERNADRSARMGLKRLVAPFILRRTKAQVLTELPAKTEVTLRIKPSDEEATFYEAVRLRALEKLQEAAEGDPKPLQILGEIMRLRRACCHPSLVLPDSNIEGSKLAQVLETIAELREGKHRALIFSQFVDHLQLVREQLDQHGISYQYLDGSTPARARKERVEAFQSGSGDVFLISLKAGGTGLNLTAADYVIHLDPWWNPAVEDQASDRAHRIGQQRPVTIYRMVLAGTIEERILELHASKRDLAESLLEGTDRSGKLTAEELLQLIKS